MEHSPSKMGDNFLGDEGTVKLGFEWREGLVNMGGFKSVRTPWVVHREKACPPTPYSLPHTHPKKAM